MAESRRAFLKQASWAALAAMWSPPVAEMVLRATETMPGLPTEMDAIKTAPLSRSVKSTVAHIWSPFAVDGAKIHPHLPREMLEEALTVLTGRPAPVCWRTLLKRDDLIGIKFNQADADVLGTNTPMAIHLVASLQDAGFTPEQIILIEAPETMEVRALKTRPCPNNWSQKTIAVAGDQEQLAGVLERITAIINVPTLQSDNLTGINGCLRNVSLPFVRRQTRYFKNHGSPCIADILQLPAIRSKLRVHLVNALRVVVDEGPAVRLANIWNHGGILASRDPVAADWVSLDLLDTERSRRRLPPIGDRTGCVPHLRDAAQASLGTIDQDYIDRQDTQIK